MLIIPSAQYHYPTKPRENESITRLLKAAGVKLTAEVDKEKCIFEENRRVRVRAHDGGWHGQVSTRNLYFFAVFGFACQTLSSPTCGNKDCVNPYHTREGLYWRINHMESMTLEEAVGIKSVAAE